ncbi:unnamed protein product, partial [Symbiodinium sp. CCMP2456]
PLPAPAQAAPKPPPDPVIMQGEIMSLVQKFGLDERIRVRLVDALTRRAATFWEDIQSLREALSTARNPPGLLSVKLTEMEQG